MLHLAPLALATPLFVAAFLACTSKILPRLLTDVLSVLTAAAVTVALAFLTKEAAAGTIATWFGGWKPIHGIAIGIAFAIDPLGAGLATLAAFLVTTALVFAWRYFESIGTLFHTLMLIFLAAMIGFCLSGDIFNLFVFFELMSVTAFALTAHKIEGSSIEGALNFAITNSIGAFSSLWGIALLYGRTGALNFAGISRALGHGPPDGLVLMAFALVTCGFFIKAAVVPFHFWLSDAHAVAPTPVCVLFSGVMVELGVYGVFRLYWAIFAPVLHAQEDRLRLLLLSLGAVTALLGALMCFWQRHVKRLLAFSTISHVGMIVAGAGTLTAHGLAGASLYVIGHGMVKASLFLSAGIFLQCFGGLDEMALRGRGRDQKFLGTVVAVAALGLAGFPPFGTYVGKALMEESAERYGQSWLVWVFGLASAVTAAAVLRVAGRIFLGWGAPLAEAAAAPTESETRETKAGSAKLPAVMMTMAALLAFLPAVSGFLPTFAQHTQAASDRFVDTRTYSATVLEAQPTGAIHSTEKVETSLKGVVIGCITAVAAVALAGLVLFRESLPRFVCRPFEIFGELVMPPLRALHNGDIRDYVAWLSLGLVAMASALTLIWRL